MRSYIVIPEGTTIVRVSASNPHYAASKAKRGKGENICVADAAVIPASSAMEVASDGPRQIPGQLSWADVQD
jgi:hypothetical protein